MSSAERHRRVAELFLAACRLDEPERRDYLDRECADDPELRGEVDELLDHDAAQPDEPLTEAGAGDAEPVGLAGMLGPYRIERLIARGGMGEVYEATQQSPVKRRVAIKVIRADLDGRQVVARFEAERQALAMMSHPNIAAVHDAGSTPDGKPYVVIEYVDGLPLTRYCDDRCATVEERIQLFRQVCAAVRHAHQRGVIHRDLKPSNVLVAEIDGQPVPKVIDFGIAKAIEQPLTDKTLETRSGTPIGTPEYMSPEQASGARDVDTRSDVYALGVILYELLTGTLPFDVESLREVSLEEMLRRIRQDEPPRPSTRFRTLDPDSRDSRASCRATDHRSLRGQLSGDLDWVTLHALEKDRERRYASAGDLGEDLGRYTRHEPVTAGPPGVRYRAAKFVRRHRLATGLTALLTALLVAFVATVVVQLRIQSEERRRAEASAERARSEADKATALVEFFQQVLFSARADRLGPEARVVDAVEDAAERVGDSVGDRPEVTAAVHEALGVIYRGWNYPRDEDGYSKSEWHLRQALALRLETLGPDHPDVGTSYLELANSFFDESDFEQVEGFAQDAIDTFRRSPKTDPRRLAFALNTLGLCQRRTGRYELAMASLRESVALLESIEYRSRETRGDTATSRESLAGVYRELARYAEAELEMRQVLADKIETAGKQDDGGVATAIYNLAATIEGQGRYAEAEALFREALEIETRLDGGTVGPWPAITVGRIAQVLALQGRYSESEPMALQAAEIHRATGAPVARWLAEDLIALARVDLGLARWPEASRNATEAVEKFEAGLGEGHPKLATPLLILARAEDESGAFEQAEAHYRQALRLAEEGRFPDHPEAIEARSALAAHLARRGRVDEALVLSQAAIEPAERMLGEAHPERARVLCRRADVLEAAGEVDEAQSLHAAARRVLVEAFDEEHRFVADADAHVARGARAE